LLALFGAHHNLHVSR